VKLLDVKQTAQTLGLSRWTVTSMFEQGSLPGFVLKSGRRKKIWRIREDALQRWIETRERETKTQIAGERRLQAL